MGRFRRRFGGLRDPQRTRKLEQANFFIDEGTAVSNSSGASTTAYTHLASIALSLDFQTAASETQRVGNVIASMQRSIEVVGMHFDWAIFQSGWESGHGADINDGMVWSCFQLATDRLDVLTTGDAPEPASIGAYDPFQTTFPTAVLSPSTPGIASRQNTLPTRIHWTKTECHTLASSDFIPTSDPTELSVPNGQFVRTRNGTFNRRVRIRLDDQHALFFIWAFRNSPIFTIPSAGPRVFRRWARGTLYYRFRQ